MENSFVSDGLSKTFLFIVAPMGESSVYINYAY